MLCDIGNVDSFFLSVFWPKTQFVGESFSAQFSREQPEVAAGGRVILPQSVLHVLIHIKSDSYIVWDCKLGNTTVVRLPKTNEKLNKDLSEGILNIKTTLYLTVFNDCVCTDRGGIIFRSGNLPRYYSKKVCEIIQKKYIYELKCNQKYINATKL